MRLIDRLLPLRLIAAVVLVLGLVAVIPGADAQSDNDHCAFARDLRSFLEHATPGTPREQRTLDDMTALADSVDADPECQPSTTSTSTTSTSTSTSTTSTSTSTTTTPPPSTTTTTTPPPAGGFPTEATTGVPAGWTPRTELTSDLVVTTPGAVIEDVRMVGADIWVRAANVTIRRVDMAGGRINNSCCIGQPYDDDVAGTSAPGLLVEDVTFRNPPGVQHTSDVYYRLGDSNYTARRVKVLDQLEGFRTGAGGLPGAGEVVIEDSYVRLDTTLVANPGCGGHPDGIQGYVGAHATITHNTIDLDTGGSCENGAIFIADSSDGADIVGNLLLGGAFTLRPHDGPFRLVDNVVADGRWQYGPLACGGGVGYRIVEQRGNRIAVVTDDYQVGATVRAISC
jgi:hypothetical protein